MRRPLFTSRVHFIVVPRTLAVCENVRLASLCAAPAPPPTHASTMDVGRRQLFCPLGDNYPCRCGGGWIGSSS